MATRQEYILKAKYEGETELGKFRKDLTALGKIESIKKLGTDVRELSARFGEAQKDVKTSAAAMGQAKKQVDELAAAYASAESALTLQTAKLKEAGKSNKEIAAATKENKEALKALKKELQASQREYKELNSAHTASQRTVTRLSAALDKKKQAFKGSTAAAKAAGVDTKKLTAEEKRLALASEETGKVWAARRALGVKSHKDINNEVVKLQAAYNDLKSSGKASAAELYQAKQRLNEKTKELKASTVNWGASVTKVYTGVIAMAGAGYAALRAFGEYSSFETGMAEVNTLLDVSTTKFGAFKEETADIVGDLPQQTQDLTKSLYDIISAGVELEASGRVLDLSARAAVAGVTETKTAVNIGVGAMNAYGKSVDDLEGIYDVLFQTVKSGVTTFPELAQNMGEVLPVARSANIELPEVGAAIAALTKAGIKTPQAATALKGAIRAMAAPAPEARAQFEALGITWNGLLPTLEQIAEKGLSIDQMRMIIPDAEASTGVLSLTQNLDEFRDILASMDQASGSMSTAYDKMADTPDHEIKLLKKTLHEAVVELGSLSSLVLLPLGKTVGWLVKQVNDGNPVVKGFIATLGGIITVGAAWKLGLGAVVSAVGQVVSSLGTGAAAMAGYTSATAAAKAGMTALTASMAANPVTAAMIGLVLAAGAAWAVFGKSSLQASKDHAKAAKDLGESRKEVDKQVQSLESIRDILRDNDPESEKFKQAQRDLVDLLPDANLKLDEQGRIIVDVGDNASEAADKIDKYVEILKEKNRLNLGLQLEQQAKAHEKAIEAQEKYNSLLKNELGVGSDTQSSRQKLNKALFDAIGLYDKKINKSNKLADNVREEGKAYDDLLKQMAKTGMTADDVADALDKAHVSAELKDAILAKYKRFSDAIEDVGDTAEKSAEKQEKVTAEAVEAIEKKYAEMAAEVKKIYDEIAERQKDLSSDLREMARSGMSDYGAWKDLKAEADEYYEAAEKAANAGDYDTAVAYADQAKSLYKQLNTEVKNGEKVVVSQKKALGIAMDGVKQAGELAINALEQQAEQAENNAKNLEMQAGEFSQNWQQAWDEFIESGERSVSAMERRLDELTKPRKVEVTVEEKSSSGMQNGGLVGLKMMLGGLLGPAQFLATGGGVRNMLGGGHFPGFGGGDRRHVVAEDGEYMLDKFSVRDASLPIVRAFHAKRWDLVVAGLIKRFGIDPAIAVKRQFGGMINAVANLPQAVSPPGPQYMAAGGAVVGSGDVSTASTTSTVYQFTGPIHINGNNGKSLFNQMVSEAERLSKRRS